MRIGENQMNNKIIILMDSVRADTFAVAKAPIMKAVGEFQVAHSVACWTLPSLINYFLGYPPIGTKVKDLMPPHDPSTLALIQEYYLEQKYATGWFSENPWMTLLDRLLANKLMKGFVYRRGYLDMNRAMTGGYPEVSRNMAEDIQKFIILNSRTPVFIMTLWMVTHHSYYDGERRHGLDPSRPDMNFANQAKSITYLDTLLEPIFETLRKTGKETDIVITSDHGECFGPDYWSHNPRANNLKFDEKLFEIPFIRGVIK